MKYGLTDLPAMMSTPLGRRQFADGIRNLLWPLLRNLARLYRSLNSNRTKQIAVIGSLGKTTATRAALLALGMDPGLQKYRNFKSPVAIQMLKVPPWRKYAVTEVGIDGPGQMEQLSRMIIPQAVIVTSIASEHQRSLMNLENTRFEKSRMVRNLPEDGLLILNGDDPNSLWIGSQTDTPVVTCGFGDSCDIRARNYRLDWPRGSSFDIEAPGGIRRFRSNLIGRHMVYPVLSALALAEYTGVNSDHAFSRLETLQPVSGRLDTIRLPGGAFLIRDDFKSSLETIYSALDVLETVPAGNRGIIIGDISEPPGSQGPLYRGLGRRIAGIADWVVFYGNKRDAYAAGALKAGMPKDAVERASHDLTGVARRALQKLQPGDVVLVKGRDTQRLDRISLALQGIRVKCDVRFCDSRVSRCDSCPMLSNGWGNKKVVI